MQRDTRLYAVGRYAFTFALIVSLWLVHAHASAQDDMSFFADPIKAALKLVTNVIGPAIGICGLIFAGVMFFNGETGRPFKIALGVIFGGVLISSAESIWTGFFHGVGVGG